MESSDPDYDFIDKTYKQIMREQPDHYPVKFNYAVALYRRGYFDLAVSKIREIVADHPAYLFARSTLLQTLLDQDQIEEAKAAFRRNRMSLRNVPKFCGIIESYMVESPLL